MKHIYLLILLGIFFFFRSANSVLAAGFSASGQFLKNPNVVRVTFPNLKGVSKVSYILMYQGNGVGQGIEGSLISGKRKSYSKDLFLGTCSKKVCIRHGNIRNMILEVTAKFTNGKSSKKVIKVK